MTEPKFTPAPWEYVKINGLIVSDHLLFSGIARVACCDEEGIANAILIATAPELYTELEKCAKLLRSYEHHHLQKGDREKAGRNREYAENCEKALSKARGESNV